MRYFFLRPKNSTCLLASLLTLTAVMLLTSSVAEAVPSFSRQLRASCSQCHTQSFGPNLTPFGRDFKMGGYTMQEGGQC